MKTLSLAMLLTVTLLYVPAPLAQDVLWTETYGGSGGDWGETVEQTDDGGFILAGTSASFGAGGWDAYLIKTDWRGDVEWTRVYGTDETCDIGTCARPTDDGGYVFSLAEGPWNLLRLDDAGDSLWAGQYQIRAASVRQTADGGFVLCGDSMGVACLLKTDADGEIDWRYLYPAGSFSQLFSVAEVEGDGYVAGGSMWSDAGSWDYYIVRTDGGGKPLWTRTYGRPMMEDEGWSLCTADDGGFVITGLYFGTLKVDAAGDSLWSHYYGAGEMGCASSICRTADHGFLVAGYVDPIGFDDGNCFLVKTDSLGVPEWQEYYEAGYMDFENGRCARQTHDGAYVMVGWTDAFGAGDMDIWLLRIDGECSGAEDPSLARDPDGVRLSLVGQNPVALPDASLRFALDLPTARDLQLTLHDAAGRLAATILRGSLPAGHHVVTWDIQAGSRKALPAGVYFVRLEAGRAGLSGAPVPDVMPQEAGIIASRVVLVR